MRRVVARGIMSRKAVSRGARSICAVLLTAALVAGGAASAAAKGDKQAIFDTLHLESGDIPLGDHLATLRLTPNYRFLDRHDARIFLTEIYDNPPDAGQDVLGLIVPTDVDPLTAAGWVVVVSYLPVGHVGDADANSIDYNAEMTEMKAATQRRNQARAEGGYATAELIGWAQKPRYDAATKELYWAKRLRYSDDPNDTLNYQIRILGRGGALALTIIAEMPWLAAVNRHIPTLLDMVQFDPGNRYADYDPAIDRAAGYGIAGLIADGAAAKTGGGAIFGSFAALWRRILAAAIVVVATAYALLRRRLARRRRDGSGGGPPPQGPDA